MPAFEEIANCGGKVTLTVDVDPSGTKRHGIKFSGSSPGPMVMMAMWALPQGVAIAKCSLTGIGGPPQSPPLPGCHQVLIGSDSHGMFGHNCPGCGGYWRSGPWPNICPYCGLHANPHDFLSKAQRQYVAYYCDKLNNIPDDAQDGYIIADMDNVAAATRGKVPKPAFYISDEAQQHKFQCIECGEVNDILGKYGYCSSCGTRNDFEEFKKKISEIHRQLADGYNPTDVLKNLVSAFDACVGQYAKQLVSHVPLSKKRSARLERERFHDWKETAVIFTNYFDISICDGIDNSSNSLLHRMFCRRHVHEHNGSEVDQRYLDSSGDTSVRLKQHISENQSDVRTIAGLLQRAVQNLHNGFHELIQPLEEPIKAHNEKLARIAAYKKGSR